MLITPNRGKRIFGFLMILLGIGAISGMVMEEFRARSRTNVTEAHILDSKLAMNGIGPVRHYSINTRYEFFVDGMRFEKQQLVDQLPEGTVYVRFDPRQPKNNALDLTNSSPQYIGMFAGVLVLIGTLLVWHSWKPLAFLQSSRALNAGKSK
jgi:uncharacterized protein YjeT (DUF2065 family)